MDEFRDSTAIGDDGDELRRRLREDGYLFLRGLLDRGAVAAARAAVLHALDRCGWLADGSDPVDARPGPAVRHEGSDGFWDGYAAIQGQEAFHRLAHDPSLGRLLRTLTGDEVVVHPRKIARISFPGDDFVTPPHQDFRYIQGTADVFTVWSPLGACPEVLGGLRVLRGSQQRGLLPVVGARGAGGLAVEVPDDDVDWASVDYQPGDVVVFHSLTVHGAIPNHTGQLRLSVDYRYQPAGEPLVRASLHPHFHPRLPDWDELTAGWSPDSLETIAPPGSVVESPMRNPAADLVVPPSRFL